MRAKARFFYFLLLVFFLQTVLVSVAYAATTRIMPLGDSITVGTTDNRPLDELEGYRQKLYLDLIDQGYDVDFVGGEESGESALPVFDIDHEGHGGFEADEIRDNIYLDGFDYLGSNLADVILLHIGTNDITSDQLTDEIVDEVEQILEKIEEFEFDIGKDVPVLLALIILRDDDKTSDTIAFNNEVRAMAEFRIAGGDNIIIVDMQNALSYPGDMDDHVHPNMTGYNKMADVWFDTLEQILPVADAGPNQSAEKGKEVVLDGSNSNDPPLNPITIYSWEQTEGTSVTISDPTVVQPTFTAPNVGSQGETLSFRLTVSSSNGLTSSDTTNVDVNGSSSSSNDTGCFIGTITE